MAIKNFSIAILFFISMASIFSTCKKGGLGCGNAVYNFKIGVRAYPDKDSIRIGDTIWFELNTPTSFEDITSGKLINYGGAANLGSAISVVKFVGGSISDPGAVYSANSFNYILVTGSQVNNPFVEGIRDYLFLESNNQYKFKLAIIPQQLGIFSLGLSNAANVYRHSDKCTKAGFEIDFENTNQHLYFLQNNRPGYVISGSELTSIYCFKVY